MALFSGGRYIRARLRAGLAASIGSVASSRADKPAGLSFWEFPGEHDGEDLKIVYKNRVTAISGELTEEERTDITEEGVRIMVLLTDVVREVAEVVPSRAVALALESTAPGRDTGFQGPVARIRPPWLLLTRSLFPFAIIEFTSTILGFMASRVPEQGAVNPLPLQLESK